MALGDTLRTARQALRISLNQAALETRIRQSVLEALEESDFNSLPPRPFLRGLLRNYALYLHLDPDTTLDEYDSETGHKSPIVSLPPQPSEPPTFASPQSNQPPEAVDSPEAFAFPPFQISSAAKPNGDMDAAPPPALDTVFQVAPEIESYVPPPTAPLNLSQEPPTLARRIGSTRIPEAVALIALAVALFALVSVGFTAFQNFSNPFAGPSTPTTTPTATATIPANSTPTGIPTLAQTLQALPTAVIEIEPTLVLSPTIVTGSGEPTQIALATATSDIPADAQMTLQIEATGDVGAWIIVDEDEVFNGTLKNETRTFTAHARLFVQIKNIGNGRVFFQGTRILPRNQQERTELYRAWLMSPLGTPVIIPPTPYPSPIAPAEFPTPTLLATNTLTPTPSATSTITPTQTSTPTQTRTLTQTSTRTLTATASATASLTLTATTTRTLTLTPTRTTTTAVTTTPTATRTLVPGVSAMSTR